jgi:YD repeat-containing protein
MKHEMVRPHSVRHSRSPVSWWLAALSVPLSLLSHGPAIAQDHNSYYQLVLQAARRGAPERVLYGYDALGRLVRVTTTEGRNLGVETSYKYDPAGNRTEVTTSGVR